MKPLIVLLATFALSCLIFYAMQHDANFILSGRIAMAFMLTFTSVAHFCFFDGMIMTMPPYIPFKRFMVYFTGILEIAAGIGLLFISIHYTVAIALIIFL
ncbi:DoxX family protein [Mucilaginibacter humi]|uniref:hypothetical protein n=1 Tax=Mucilaginibacter humi TaxID=2732510 RepID=UPI001C2E2E46|nr:hypothetical protein [Mucilaginibacter humi]